MCNYSFVLLFEAIFPKGVTVQDYWAYRTCEDVGVLEASDISSPISRSRLSSINALFLVGLTQNIQDFPGVTIPRFGAAGEDVFCLKCSMTIVLLDSQVNELHMGDLG